MMKKMLAILMTLVMTLSCTGAFAQDLSEETMVQLYINPLLAQAGYNADAENAKMMDTIFNTFNGMKWTVTEGENATKMVFSMNDSAVYEYTFSADEEGLLVFSDLWPNSVFKLNFAKLGEVLEALLGDMDATVQAMGETVNALAGSLQGYVEDLGTVAGEVAASAETDEASGSMYISITAHHVAKLLIKWIERLEQDPVMMDFAEGLVQGMAMADGSEPVNLQETLAALKAELQAGLESEAAVEICSLGIFNEADGTVSYELAIGNTQLILLQAYPHEGMDVIDIVNISSYSGTEDWNATYDGVLNGTNQMDSVTGVVYAVSEDGAEEYFEFYTVNAGSHVSISVEQTQKDMFTDNWTKTGVLSVDMTEGTETINVMGAAWETKLVEKLVAPSTEGKYVHDVLAFPLDVLMNGLPQYLERLYTAAPDFIQMYVNLLAEAFGLEELPFDLGKLMPAGEGTEAPANGQQAPENGTAVVTGDVIDDL